jgi:FtsP/CotA-like multicopper oxidase with cupredoxin domain
MSWLRVSLAALGLAHAAYGATVTFPLSIVNKVISPDGFSRSYVSLLKFLLPSSDSSFHFPFFRAITPNGVFPGPTIKLQKGDSVNIPVHNQLTDPGMRRSTSIVSVPFSFVRRFLGTRICPHSSTGMDSSRLGALMPMALRECFSQSSHLHPWSK